MKLSIVIPVYNEETTIASVLKRVRKVKLGKIKKEIIVVDDGSTDRTKKIIAKERLKRGTIIRTYHSVINLGKGAATRIGLSYADGDIVIIQDADLELNPEEYKVLLDPFISGRAEVVYGSRFLKRNRVSAKTVFANKVLTFLTNLLYSSNISDMETAYKVFRKEVIAKIAPKLRCVEYDFEPEITAQILLHGYKIREIPISYKPRIRDEGKRIGFADGIAAIYTLFKCRFMLKKR